MQGEGDKEQGDHLLLEIKGAAPWLRPGVHEAAPAATNNSLTTVEEWAK